MKSIIKNLKPFQKAEYICLILFALLVPISWNIATYVMFILFVTTILKSVFEDGFKQNLLQSRNKTANFIFIAFWVLYAIGFLYSENSAEARIQIGKKLSFLLFSLFFLFSDLSYLTKKRIKIVIYSFVMGIFVLLAINLIWALFDILFNGNDIERLTYSYNFFKINNGKIIPYLHRGYFSIMASVALVFCMMEFLESKESNIKILNFLSSILLIFIPFFLMSRAGILCIIMTLLIIWIYLTFIQKRIKIGIISGSLILLSSVIGYFCFPKAIERFTNTFENVRDGKGDCRITIRNANRYVVKENFVFGVGTGDRSEETMKSYKRYKDNVAAKMKSGSIIDAEIFEQNKRDLLDSINAKFENEYNDNVYRYIDSIGNIQNMDFSTVKENLPEYQITKHCIKYELNAHNQYNDTIIAVGISGVILLLMMFFFPIYLWIRTKTFDIFFFAFLFIFAFNSLFESVFERQMGIMFFTLFYFLLFHANFCQQTTDN